MKTTLIIFVLAVLSNIGFSQNLVPLDVNYNLKLEFEKVMIPQIEEKYFWHEKIIAFYEVESNPIFKDFVNLAVKSEAGDIYYFAWVNVNIMPQLVTAVNSKRITEGVMLKMQMKAEKEYAIKIEKRNTVIKNVDSLHAIYKNDLSIIISNEISEFNKRLKYQSPEKSEFVFLDSINTIYRNKIDSIILSESKQFEDSFKNYCDIKFNDLYITCSRLALDTFLSADSKFENDYSNLPTEIHEVAITELDKVIEDIAPIKSEQKKLERMKFDQVENEIQNINDNIHGINYIILTTKIRKKHKINLCILLRSNFPGMTEDIEIIEVYLTKTLPKSVYIDEFDYYIGIKESVSVNDSIYQRKKEQWEMYQFIENYLNAHKK